MEFKYLVDAADAMVQYHSESLELSSEDIRRNLTVACNALRVLERDEEFPVALREMISVRATESTNFRSIVDDVTHFTKGFLVLEERAMQKAGLSRPTIELLLNESRNLRSQLSKQVIEPTQVQASIDTLRTITCTQAAVLSNAIVTSEQRFSTRWVLTQVSRGLAGVVLIVVNFVVAPTVDMSSVGSTVSTHLGVSILSTAATNLNNGYREAVGNFPR